MRTYLSKDVRDDFSVFNRYISPVGPPIFQA